MRSRAAELIVFDLDGTLVDTAPDLVASLNHVLDGLGRPPMALEAVRAEVGRGARHLLGLGLAASGERSDALVEAGIGPFLAHYGANIARHSRPFPGAQAALDHLLAAGRRLAICTNKPEALARDLLQALGWDGRFAALLGADSRPWRKPDPRHLFDTIAAAGGGHALFVGDSRTDSETAQAAGIPLILVRFGYSAEPVDTLGADALIDSFDALPAAILAIQDRFNGEGAPAGP